MRTAYVGPPVDDHGILNRLPDDIAEELRKVNSYIDATRGFHLRGACLSPPWHSIRAAWEGELALHTLFPNLHEEDVPLAEDCFGDQYLLRDGFAIRLLAETGDVEEMSISWVEFLMNVDSNAVKYLRLGLLRQFEIENPPLAPGFALSVYPPFVANEYHNPSMRAISTLELRTWRADFAKQIKDIPDGQQIKILIS